MNMRGRGFRRSLSDKDVAPTGNVLYSSRLLLREIPAGEMRTLLKRDPSQPYQWAEGYPTEGTLIAGEAYVRQIDEKRWRPGFGMYQIVRRSDRTIIGDSGFLSAPDPQGRVALGYGLAPSARGHGYATEALITLTRWALDQPGIVVVTADTSHDNVKSQAVMERAGLREVRSDEELRYYEARRSGWLPTLRGGAVDA